MQKNTIHQFLNLFIILSFFSCKKESSQGEIEIGAISGTISLYDDKINLQSNASGVTVTVIGMPGKVAVSTADGKFRIEGLSFDNYDLAFSKTGYGTYKIFGIEHKKQSNTPSGVSSTTFLSRVINLGAVSSTSISSLTAIDATYNDLPGIEYGYTITPEASPGNRGYVRTFVGKKHTTSSAEYLAYTNTNSVLNNNVRSGFQLGELYGFGFQSGDSVYVKVYGDSFYSNTYTDPISGKTIFPNLNAVAANAVSFIVP